MIWEAETEHKPQTQITINMAETILSKYTLSKYLRHFLQICFEQIWDKKTNGQRQTHNNIAVKQVYGIKKSPYRKDHHDHHHDHHHHHHPPHHHHHQQEQGSEAMI